MKRVSISSHLWFQLLWRSVLDIELRVPACPRTFLRGPLSQKKRLRHATDWRRYTVADLCQVTCKITVNSIHSIGNKVLLANTVVWTGSYPAIKYDYCNTTTFPKRPESVRHVEHKKNQFSNNIRRERKYNMLDILTDTRKRYYNSLYYNY